MMDFITSQDSLLSDGTLAELHRELQHVGNLDELMKPEPFGDNPSCMQNTNFNCEANDIVGFEFSYLPSIMPDSTQQTNNTDVTMTVVPPATGRLPSTTDYKGPCNFDIDQQSSVSKKWRYSPRLNKMFVTMLSKIPIKFSWNQEYGLFVRALPIFLDEDDFEYPVRRCASHTSDLEPSNKDFTFVDHVIRCDHEGTVYDKNPESGRLSVVVPLDCSQPGTTCTTIVYTFMCKNSCSVGINRRATAIVFTLERENGEVIGRRVVKIRICSCPKRDMEKEENLEGKPCDKEPESTTNNGNSVPPPSKILLVPFSKKLKRSLPSDMEHFSVRLPKKHVVTAAKLIKVLVSSEESSRPLSHEEKVAVSDCNNYIK